MFMRKKNCFCSIGWKLLYIPRSYITLLLLKLQTFLNDLSYRYAVITYFKHVWNSPVRKKPWARCMYIDIKYFYSISPKFRVFIFDMDVRINFLFRISCILLFSFGLLLMSFVVASLLLCYIYIYISFKWVFHNKR